MYYEKRGDPFPIMELDDEVPNKLRETNEMRRQLNKYHWAFREVQRDIRWLGYLFIAFITFLITLIVAVLIVR